MKKIILKAIIIMITNNIYCSEIPLNNLKFASIEKANELLTQEDNFTKNWSQFDIDSRLNKKNSIKKELFEFIKSQTKKWSTSEIKKINSVFKSINKSIEKNNYKITFPNEIYFIKTTGKEEGGADGYTRENYIVLSQNTLLKSKTKIKEIVIHELFHILTRNNPEFRKKLYQIIGFNIINDIEYPNSLKNFRITNPDAPEVDNFITLKVNGESKDCTMILYSKQDYNGGSFFKYLNIGFLSLTGTTDKTVEFKNNEPLIYSFKDVKNFYDKVGKNTDYIIHPEEILAENFVFTLLNKKALPNTEIINKIKEILREEK